MPVESVHGLKDATEIRPASMSTVHNFAQKRRCPTSCQSVWPTASTCQPIYLNLFSGLQCSQHSHTHPTPWRGLMVGQLPGQSRLFVNTRKPRSATWRSGSNTILMRREKRKLLSSMPLHCDNVKIFRRQDTEGQRGN